MPVGVRAQRCQVLQDDDIDDAVHRQGDLFVPGWTPLGKDLRCHRGSYHDDRVQLPRGLVGQRRDVLADDHDDDAVHRQGDLFVPGRAPVGNELRHHHRRPSSHDHDVCYDLNDDHTSDNYRTAYDDCTVCCVWLLGVAGSARVSDPDTLRVVVGI